MRNRTRFALLGSLMLPFVQQACVGDSEIVTDGGTDATTNDSPTTDGAKTDGTASCVPACVNDASTFHDCDGGVAIDNACSFGCLASPSVHCGVFNPTGLVEPSDFQIAGLGDFDPCAADAGSGLGGCSFVLHTDTGKIDNGGTTVLRPINADPNVVEVGNGIGFHLASYDGGAEKVAIFSFKNFNLRGGELHVAGPNPVAIVAQGDMLVMGLIEMWDTQFFGQCIAAGGGGAGGGSGSASPSLGGGGAGSGSTYVTGGGGGGSGGAGGAGGYANITAGGPSGGAFNEGFNPLRGGGGGGGAGPSGGGGGAGGGAIALFANGTITISPGLGGGPVWGVNAGGCGSPATFSGPENGGAGAGGAILVEGHAVIGLGANAGLAANGGSGGGSNLGVRGTISNNPAPGTTATTYSTTCYGTGGNGGAGTTQGAAGGNASCTTPYGGGGGGGLGRIEIGSYAPLVADGGFIISPPQTNIAVPVE